MLPATRHHEPGGERAGADQRALRVGAADRHDGVARHAELAQRLRRARGRAARRARARAETARAAARAAATRSSAKSRVARSKTRRLAGLRRIGGALAARLEGQPVGDGEVRRDAARRGRGRAARSPRRRVAGWIGWGQCPVRCWSASPCAAAHSAARPKPRASRFGVASSTAPAASSSTLPCRMLAAATRADLVGHGAGPRARLCAPRRRPPARPRADRSRSRPGTRGRWPTRMVATPSSRGALRGRAGGAHAAAAEVETERVATVQPHLRPGAGPDLTPHHILAGGAVLRLQTGSRPSEGKWDVARPARSRPDRHFDRPRRLARRLPHRHGAAGARRRLRRGGGRGVVARRLRSPRDSKFPSCSRSRSRARCSSSRATRRSRCCASVCAAPASARTTRARASAGSAHSSAPVRGVLVVLLVAYLALWLDALRATGRELPLSPVADSATARATGAVVEAGAGRRAQRRGHGRTHDGAGRGAAGARADRVAGRHRHALGPEPARGRDLLELRRAGSRRGRARPAGCRCACCATTSCAAGSRTSAW